MFHQQRFADQRAILTSAGEIAFQDLLEWSRQIASLASRRGDAGFYGELERAIASWIVFDEFTVFAYRESGGVQTLHGNLPEPRKDRVIACCAETHKRGASVFQEAFRSSPSRSQPTPFDIRGSRKGPSSPIAHSGIDAELGFITDVHGGCRLVASLAKSGTDSFTSEEARFLSSVQPLLSTLVAEHFDSAESAAAPADPLAARLDFLSSRGVSQRELQVVRLIIAGHSNHSISEHLEIAVGTVKIHRKNIYRKLRVSAQAELFSLVFGGGAHAA